MDESQEPVLVFDMPLNPNENVPHMESEVDAAQLFSKANNVGPELLALWDSEKFMDVQLICGAGNTCVKAHRLVLAALSPVFRQIFIEIGPFSEEDYVIVLAEVEANVIQSFLQRIYMGQSFPVVIDPQLEHLKLNDIVKAPIRGEIAKDFNVKTAIKNEPGLLSSTVNNLLLDDGDEEVRKFKLWQQHRAQLEQEMLLEPEPETGVKQEPLDDGHDHFSDLMNDEDVGGADDHGGGGEDGTGLKSSRSKVWKYFDKVEKDFSKCKTCFCIIKTQKGNTSGMSRHLSRVHPELFEEYEQKKDKAFDNNEDSDDDFSPFKSIIPPTITKKKTKKRALNSARKTRLAKANFGAGAKKPNSEKVWEFFDQVVEDGDEAKCKTCLVMIKTDSGENISGLLSHLQVSHPEQHEEVQADTAEMDVKNVNTSGARNSPVWQFYSEIGSNRVKCNKCETVLKYYYGTTSGLLRHLRRSHPEDYETIKTDETCNDLGGDVNETVLAMDNDTIWKFFNRNDDQQENIKANCVDCLLEITDQHGSLITSCEEHLRGCHTDLLEQYESQRKAFVQELIKSDKTAVKRKYTSRVVASAIWSFFKKSTTSANLNQCLTCLIEVDCSQNSTAMVKHLEEAHPDQHEAFKKSSGIDAKDIKKPSAIWKHFRSTGDPKKHKCVVCDKEIICHFHTTSNMIRHLEHNHVEIFEEFLRESHGLDQNVDVDPLFKKPKKRNMKQKPSTDPSDRTCPDCGKEYSCRPAMLFHYKCVHSGIRPYKCEQCGMTFARQDSWKGHTHSKVRSFLCSICGKTFARRNIRDTHERAHLNDRRYPCSFCGKKFMTNQQRTNHERTHTGEKPFQCTDCGRQFAQQHQLTTHTRIHTGEKPYSCPHCNQKFRHLSSRNNHKCDGKIAANQFATPASANSLATHITVSWTE